MHRLLFNAALLFGALLFQNTSYAQSVQSPGAIPAPVIATEDMLEEAAPSMTYNDVDAFVSGIIGEAIANHQIGGAVVTLSKGKETLLAKGFGQARLTPPTHVDGDRHLFRLASISKTFTWIALFQLVERGLIAFDDPINTHLPPDLQIPDQGFKNPIRITHLMAHESGFEDLALGHIFFQKGDDVPTLHEYLSLHRPDRVREPGQIPNYSNYGVALAGAIIAEKSGLPFEAYVEEYIFTPLGMDNSSFREPFTDGRLSALPPSDEGNFAKGLSWKNGYWEERPFLHINHVAPAAAFSSTAADMDRYMRALLSFENGGAEILSRRFWDQLPSGLTSGFFSYDFGTLKGFGHDGSAIAFRSRLFIDRENDLGIFISVNSATGQNLIRNFPYLIQQRYFAAPKAVGNAKSANDLDGFYRTTRRPYSGFEKALISLNGTLKITTENNTLHAISLDQNSVFTALSPTQFHNPNSGDIWTLNRDDEGQIIQVTTAYQTTVFEKLSGFQHPILLILSWAGAFILSAFLLVRYFSRSHADIGEPLLPSLFSKINAALWSAFTLYTLSHLGLIALSGQEIIFDYPGPGIYINLILGLFLTFSLTVGLLSLLYSIYQKQLTISEVAKYSAVNLYWLFALYPLWEIGLISLTP